MYGGSRATGWLARWHDLPLSLITRALCALSTTSLSVGPYATGGVQRSPTAIAGHRLQLGISRGSPEQVVDGWRYFGYKPAEGEDDADMARRHATVFLDLLRGEGFAEPNPHPMFPNPPGLLTVEPQSPSLRDRIWWGAASPETAAWAASLGMNLQSSTLVFDDASGDPFHIVQARHIAAFRSAWNEAGHEREPRLHFERR